MYCGKCKVALYIHRITAQILRLTRGLLQNETRVCVCVSASVCVCFCVCGCVCVCICVCVGVCVCVCIGVCVCCACDNSKSDLSRNIKLKYIVGYKYISEKFDNGHGWIKVKVTVGH